MLTTLKPWLCVSAITLACGCIGAPQAEAEQTASASAAVETKLDCFEDCNSLMDEITVQAERYPNLQPLVNFGGAYGLQSVSITLNTDSGIIEGGANSRGGTPYHFGTQGAAAFDQRPYWAVHKVGTWQLIASGYQHCIGNLLQNCYIP
jgi:hypothetical protein